MKKVEATHRQMTKYSRQRSSYKFFCGDVPRRAFTARLLIVDLLANGFGIVTISASVTKFSTLEVATEKSVAQLLAERLEMSRIC